MKIFSDQTLFFDALRKNGFRLIELNINGNLLELKTKNHNCFSIPIKNITQHWNLKNKQVTRLLSTKHGRNQFLNDYNNCLSIITTNFK